MNEMEYIYILSDDTVISDLKSEINKLREELGEYDNDVEPSFYHYCLLGNITALDFIYRGNQIDKSQIKHGFKLSCIRNDGKLLKSFLEYGYPEDIDLNTIISGFRIAVCFNNLIAIKILLPCIPKRYRDLELNHIKYLLESTLPDKDECFLLLFHNGFKFTEEECNKLNYSVLSYINRYKKLNSILNG